MDLPKSAQEGILALAKKHNIQKVILFGSRARGDNWQRSDIDLAITGGNTVAFSIDVNEDVKTILMFDVVNLDEPVQQALLDDIARDGVVIYEKI